MFDSIFQDVQDVHTFAPLQAQCFSKNRFKKPTISVKFQKKMQILQHLQNFAKILKMQLDNLVDLKRC